MPRARDLDPGADLLAYFGAELRRARMAAGLSMDELGRAIHYSGAQVGRVENGERLASLQFVQRCDVKLGTDGRFERLWDVVRRYSHTHPSGFLQFLDYEAEAVSISEFIAQAVPGLLQTEDYARAVFRASQPGKGDEEIEQLVASRLARQAILNRPKPPMLWFVLWEALLRCPVGGPEVMAVQIAHMIEVASLPNVVLQVLPFAAGAHAGLLGQFTLLTLPGGAEAAYTESVRSAQMIERPEDVAEFALVYKVLQTEALSPAASLEFLTRVQGEYDREAESR